MPRKSQTPPPPRTVQSPKARAPERSAEDRRRLLILVAVAASGLVGLAAVIGLFALSSSGSTGDAASALEEAGCTLQEVRAEEAGNHVTTPPKRSEYNTWPPTSGRTT